MEKGVDFEERVRAICSIVKGPVSVETTTHDLDDILHEARSYAKIAKNVVVKVGFLKDFETRGYRILNKR